MEAGLLHRRDQIRGRPPVEAVGDPPFPHQLPQFLELRLQIVHQRPSGLLQNHQQRFPVAIADPVLLSGRSDGAQPGDVGLGQPMLLGVDPGI